MVITGLTRNQFAGNGTWVRIPPSPPKQDARATHGRPALLLRRKGFEGRRKPTPQCGVGPPRGAMARSSAVWKTSSPRPSRRIPPSPPKQGARATHGRPALLLRRKGFEGRKRGGRSAASPRPGERWPGAAQSGRQAARGLRGESHPLRQSRAPVQRTGALRCLKPRDRSRESTGAGGQKGERHRASRRMGGETGRKCSRDVWPRPGGAQGASVPSGVRNPPEAARGEKRGEENKTSKGRNRIARGAPNGGGAWLRWWAVAVAVAVVAAAVAAVVVAVAVVAAAVAAVVAAAAWAVVSRPGGPPGRHACSCRPAAAAHTGQDQSLRMRPFPC